MTNALSHCLLNEYVCTSVDGCGLIQKKNLWVARDCRSEAEELALTNRVIGSIVLDDSIKFGLV